MENGSNNLDKRVEGSGAVKSEREQAVCVCVLGGGFFS